MAPPTPKTLASPGLISASAAHLLLLAVALLALVPSVLRAQSLRYNLGPGSRVGVPTQVEPTDCVTDPTDGSVTCGTKLVNPPGDTPARPSFEPFSN
uniref:hypothetical protein n=1 Tax=Synechococcus sp. CS-1329 TaxID=2847975 RepID=UPI00223C38AF|nr:hypothetical protein [Synechococcus sp. CS-1329]